MNSGSTVVRSLFTVLIILVVGSGCSSQASDENGRPTDSFALTLANEKQKALSLVESQPDAKRTAIKYPGESWSVDSNYEDAMSSDDSNHTYCPHEYDVYYGRGGTDADSAVWMWHVNVKVKEVGKRPISWAQMLSFTPPPEPSPGFEEGDRLDLCWDGKPPAIAYPEDNSAGQ